MYQEWRTIGGPNFAQSGYQGEERAQEDDQAEDGKTTQQGRSEPSGSGKQQAEDNGGHWWRATSCSGWTKPRWKAKGEIFVFDRAEWNRFHLLPWNMRSLTLSFSFLSISSLSVLLHVVLCFRCLYTGPHTCIFQIILFSQYHYPKSECYCL